MKIEWLDIFLFKDFSVTLGTESDKLKNNQMIRKLYLILLVLVFGTIIPSVAQVADKQSFSLMPYPMEVTKGEGKFVFTNKTVVAVEDEGSELIAKDFVQLFSKAAGFTPKLKVGSKKGDVLIRIDKEVKPEAYVLDINPEKIVINTSGAAGAFYALQTIRQLLPLSIEGGSRSDATVWSVPALTIKDEPRFNYRGLMVDVARYFISKAHLFRIIDTMGMLKLNKLHLHLTDDNGWRLEIKQYPLLTEIGSKTVARPGQAFPERKNARQGEPLVDGGFYTQEDIKEIVAYEE